MNVKKDIDNLVICIYTERNYYLIITIYVYYNYNTYEYIYEFCDD